MPHLYYQSYMGVKINFKKNLWVVRNTYAYPFPTHNKMEEKVLPGVLKFLKGLGFRVFLTQKQTTWQILFDKKEMELFMFCKWKGPKSKLNITLFYIIARVFFWFLFQIFGTENMG